MLCTYVMRWSTNETLGLRDLRGFVDAARLFGIAIAGLPHTDVTAQVVAHCRQGSDGQRPYVDHSPSSAPRCSTADRAVSSLVCPYTSPVMAIELCPRRSATALICVPDYSHATAALWRSV